MAFVLCYIANSYSSIHENGDFKDDLAEWTAPQIGHYILLHAAPNQCAR